MNDLRYLLDRYQKLLSNRESVIKDSLERCTKSLHCQEVGRIPVWQVSQTSFYKRHEIYQDKYKNLVTALAKCVLSMEHDTDYVPFLDPFEGVTIMAEAFGCKVKYPENNDPFIAQPIINNPEDVFDLKKPKLNNPVYKKIFETLKYWQDNTGSIIPLGNTDPQSPLDVASLIWKTDDFLTACYTHKKEVHYLIDMLTDAFIEFYSAQHDMIKKSAYPVHAFPLVNSNDGIAISDDQVVLMTPELYKEFGVPSLQKISEAFGGLYYHSCGDWGPFMDDILSIKGLRAVNGHLSPKEFKPSYIKKALSKGIGVFLGISHDEIGWDNPDWSPEERINLYDKYYIPAAIANSGGKGIVLTGYIGYSGYFDTFPESINFNDNRGGSIIEKLMNLSIEEKNRNFEHIRILIKKCIENIGKGTEYKDKIYLKFAQKDKIGESI
jgi:uroporphyrinogen-III decarboxylase